MLTHLDEQGNAHIVDVSEKTASQRVAVAEALISFNQETYELLLDNALPKGDVFATARIAGIQAAKKCSDLIPLCHPLGLTAVSIKFESLPDTQQIKVLATCKLKGVTGVEMEALTAVSISALTIYDMCKALDKSIIIGPLRLVEKTGGKSGPWKLVSDDSLQAET